MMSDSTYLQKHALYPPQLTVIPAATLGLCIVIPCHNELDILRTLNSLRQCTQPACAVEILIVINHASNANQTIKQQNARSIRAINDWRTIHETPDRRFHTLVFDALSPAHAGVGLARKLGMDEAFARFQSIGQADGIIASLDADCECATNYLQALHQHFRHYPRTPGCSIYFEHPLDSDNPRLRQGIILYELYLRYYIHGLRYSGFPNAFQTVGSAFAVRTPIYGQQGGMNRRQAGEDFYFLHKLMPLGHFSELNTTCVMPAARPSDRAPFGTGQVLRDWLAHDENTYSVYAPEVFRELQQLCAAVEAMYEGHTLALGATMTAFLAQHDFDTQRADIRKRTASLKTFSQRFYRWFNGLRAVQFAHYASDHGYAKVSVERAAATLLRWRNLSDTPPDDAESLLMLYRDIDRQ